MVAPTQANIGGLQQLQGLQQNAAVAAAQQQQQKQTRAFVGVVTKLQDNYGFVDDDVFFQLKSVRFQIVVH